MTRQEIFVNVFSQLKIAGIVRNKGDFARRLEYAPSYLSSAFSGNRPWNLSDKLFSKLLTVFPQVNETYVRTGCGEVLSCGTTQVLPGILTSTSIGHSTLLDSLIAEREAMYSRLDQINRIIEVLSPRELSIKHAC